jgi:hypothetical protein
VVARSILVVVGAIQGCGGEIDVVYIITVHAVVASIVCIQQGLVVYKISAEHHFGKTFKGRLG